MNNKKIAFYLLGYKGFVVLQNFLHSFPAEKISCVVIGTNNNIDNDFSKEISELCVEYKVTFCHRSEAKEFVSDMTFCIGWRWLMPAEDNKLIVLHDSLLPKYRGFNPLVTALINRDSKIGVTALYADNNGYDKGNIILQKSIDITYPIKISKAIELIAPLYSELVLEICYKLFNNILIDSKRQDEAKASYSVWRDQADYKIDWNLSAEQISVFIDAVGSPYEGAQTQVDGMTAVIIDAEPLADVLVENRSVGKVLFVENGYPIVLCGQGLLKITKMINKDNQENMLPLKKFRVRFK